MATSKKSDAPVPENDTRTTQEVNFDAARETSRINHERDVAANTVSGNEGVEVREAKVVEVINPVRDQATGELQDDTRTLKETPEEIITPPEGE